jgi:hypothetical protein
MNSSLLPDSLKHKPGSSSVPELVGSFLTIKDTSNLSLTSRNALDEFGSGKRIQGYGDQSVGVLESKIQRLLVILDTIVPDEIMDIHGDDYPADETLRELIFRYLKYCLNNADRRGKAEMGENRERASDIFQIALMMVMMVEKGKEIFEGEVFADENTMDDARLLFKLVTMGIRASRIDPILEIRKHLREEEEAASEGGGSRKRSREVQGGKTFYEFS